MPEGLYHQTDSSSPCCFFGEGNKEDGGWREGEKGKGAGGSRSTPWGEQSLILKVQLSNVNGSDTRKTN